MRNPRDRLVACAAFLFLACPAAVARDAPPRPAEMAGCILAGDPGYQTRTIRGWAVYVNRDLLAADARRTARALELLDKQLEDITTAVPKVAVAKLQRVPLYFNPEYPGVRPVAEYHPGADWLRRNGRNPAMARGVEFTNVRIYEAEANRMPWFVLHELAHGYHDRELPKGFSNPEVAAAYARAKESGKYDKVERHFGNGRPNAFEKAYAMTTPMEYFAEATEAYFGRNDFFPFTRDELRRHDPDVFELLGKLWQVTADPPPPAAGGREFAPDQSRLPTPPPKGATVLLNGRGWHSFLSMAGDKFDWPIEDGVITSTSNKKNQNHIVSKLHFRDADIHVEFLLPEKGSGNSGVYIHGNYEIQILNSFGKEKVTQEDAGALYGFSAPLVNACKKPGEWQVFDIRYRAPRRDEAGTITENGTVTVWINGTKVQDGAQFGEPKSVFHPFRYGKTPYLDTIRDRQKKTMTGPLFLQDHGNPVKFRNVWVLPADDHAFTYAPDVK